MKRRSTLRALTAAGLLPAALVRSAGATPQQQALEPGANSAEALPLRERFAAALENNPALLGYRSVTRADQHTPDVKTRGSWPAQLQGSLYRNGPGRHEIGDFRYQHWFDGDGLLQAWHLRGGATPAIEHRARLIRTHKYLAEEAAGRALFPGFGTLPPDSRGTPSADSVNPANISVLHHHNKLFALWEAGSPYAMNADNLDTLGEAAFRRVTSEETISGVPFSAHPRVEPDGSLWNFGYVSAMHKLVLWHMNAAGGVKKTALIDCDPISMVHDCMVTERHLLLLVCPLHYERNSTADNFLDLHRWYPDRPTQVLVIDKNDFSRVQRLELPAQWIFHFSNAWEDRKGVIRFEAASSASPELLGSTFRNIMAGDITPAEPPQLNAYRIDTRRGTASQDLLRGGSSEFPIVSQHTVGRRHQRVLLLSDANSPHMNLNQLSVLDPATGKEQSYRFPDHLMPEEHLFVGQPDRKGIEPWIMGTALNYEKQRTELHLYRTAALAQGPVASAYLDYALPLGLHGKFVATA